MALAPLVNSNQFGLIRPFTRAVGLPITRFPPVSVEVAKSSQYGVPGTIPVISPDRDNPTEVILVISVLAETAVPVSALPGAGGVPVPYLTAQEALPAADIFTVASKLNVCLALIVGVNAIASPAIEGAVLTV